MQRKKYVWWKKFTLKEFAVVFFLLSWKLLDLIVAVSNIPVDYSYAFKDS